MATAPFDKGNKQRIVGVEQDMLEEFLRLVRDAYPIADKANFFLERHTRKTNIVGITNLRDVLSHLASFLREDATDDKRAEQLTNAKEHVRRSILEPYETAFLSRLEAFHGLYDQYKKEFLPSTLRQHPALSAAPDQGMIDTQMTQITELADAGRASKAENDWTKAWDVGVKSYVQAFNELSLLHAELEKYWNQWETVRRDEEQNKKHKHSIGLHYAGIAVAFVLFVIADDKFDLIHKAKAILSRLLQAH
jgi:hypothetical protein